MEAENPIYKKCFFFNSEKLFESASHILCCYNSLDFPLNPNPPKVLLIDFFWYLHLVSIHKTWSQNVK